MAMTSMRRTSLTMLAIIAMGLAGCHHGSNGEPTEPEIPQYNPEMLTLNLDISYDVNGSGITTRSDKADGDGYEQATGNFEKISTLRVIIVRNVMIIEKSGVQTVYGEVEANRLVATTDEGYPRYDNLEFEVIANENKRIYLIANEKSIPSIPQDLPADFPGNFASPSAFLDYYSPKEGVGAVELNPLADWTVSIPVTDPAKDETTTELYSDAYDAPARLPLTEYFDIKMERDEANIDNIYYSQLFVTRTAAKATFIVDQENSSPAYDDVKITALTLRGIGSEEYLFPRETKYSKDKYPEGELLGTTNTWSRPTSESLKMYVKDFATPPGSKPLTFLKEGLDISVVNKNPGENTQREIFGPVYFPESILAKDKHYEVGVKLSTGVWLTAPLETNILNIGGLDAVARNTHLKIILRLTPVNLEAVATVLPYTAVSLNPEFGFSAPETDRLTVAPTMELIMNGDSGLIYPTFTSAVGNTIQNVYWVSSNPNIVLLGNEVTDPSNQLYKEPASSIDLSYLQDGNPVPVRVIPTGVGSTNVTAYTQSGLVARCRVTVKQ